MMTPNIGLMALVSIQMKDSGTISENAATSSTINPIHRAMKSHIFFIVLSFLTTSRILSRQSVPSRLGTLDRYAYPIS